MYKTHIGKWSLILFVISSIFFLLLGLSGCGFFSDSIDDTVTDNIEADSTSYDVWDGSIANEFNNGNGTINDPYQISTGAELAYFSKVINDGLEEYSTAYYCLVNSIDLNGLEWTPIGSASISYDEWTPGGKTTISSAHPFSGVFNGKDCIIKNYVLTSSHQINGFFGYVKSGVIKKTGFEDFTFSCTYSSSMRMFAGGIVGYMQNESEISNCYVASDIIATAKGDDIYVGGIAGYSTKSSNIKNCFVVGNVTGKFIANAKLVFGQIVYASASEANVGGICATNEGIISDCYVKGDVLGYTNKDDFCRAGGIVASNWSAGKIERCYVVGNIKAETEIPPYAGGIVSLNDGTITDCFVSGNISIVKRDERTSDGGIGGIVGYSYGKEDNTYFSGTLVKPEKCSVSKVGNSIANSSLKNPASVKSIFTDQKCWVITNDHYPDLIGLPTTYTITLNKNTSRSFLSEKTFFTEPDNKAGYNFTGWSVGEKYITDSEGNSLQNVSFAKDVDATSMFTAINYIASFYVDDILIDSISFTVETVNLDVPDVPEKIGYVGQWENYIISANDLKIEAEYVAENYTIKYIADVELNNNITNYTIESESFNLLDVFKKGYTFKGWYLDEACTEPISKIEKGTIGDLSIYAKFSSNEYKLVLDSNGGTECAEQQIQYDDSYRLPIPFRKGHNFTGWKIDGKAITDNEGCSIEVWNYAYDRTATAQWEIATYHIQYHNCKDIINSNIESYTIDDSDFILEPLAKEGYTFLGWFTDEQNENKIEKIEVLQTQNYDIFASWETIQYSINYLNTKGFNNTNPFFYDIETDTINLTDIREDGYTFLGWYNGDNPVERIPKGSIGNIDLSARWNSKTYSIGLSDCPTDIWDGTTTVTGFYDGTGTKENPYIINSASQFMYFIKSNDSFKDKYIELNSNIDLNSIKLNSGKANFSGHFDGCNFKISNIVIQTTTMNTGLFNYISGSGSITNLIIEINIISQCKEAVTGGIAGKVLGTSFDEPFIFENLKVVGDVSVKYETDVTTLIGGGVFGSVKYADIKGVESNVNVIVSDETTAITTGTGYTHTNSFGVKYTSGAYYTIAGGFAGEIFSSNIQYSKANGIVKSIIMRTGTSNKSGTNNSYDMRAFCGGFVGIVGGSLFENCYAICDIQAKSNVYNYYLSTSSYKCSARSNAYCGGFIGATGDGNSFSAGSYSANFCYFTGAIDCYSYSVAAGDPSSSGSTRYNSARGNVRCGGFSSSSGTLTNCSAKASVKIYARNGSNIDYATNTHTWVTFYGFAPLNTSSNNRYYITSLSIDAIESLPYAGTTLQMVNKYYDNAVSSNDSTVFNHFNEWQLVNGYYELAYNYEQSNLVSYGEDFRLPALNKDIYIGWYSIIDGEELQITDSKGNSLPISALIEEDLTVYPKFI